MNMASSRNGYESSLLPTAALQQRQWGTIMISSDSKWSWTLDNLIPTSDI